MVNGSLTTSTSQPLPRGEGTGGWPAEALGGPLAAADGWLYDDADGSWIRLPRPKDAPATPGPSVGAGNVLVVYGGANWDGPDEPDEWTPENVWSTGARAYRVD